MRPVPQRFPGILAKWHRIVSVPLPTGEAQAAPVPRRWATATNSDADTASL